MQQRNLIDVRMKKGTNNLANLYNEFYKFTVNRAALNGIVPESVFVFSTTLSKEHEHFLLNLGATLQMVFPGNGTVFPGVIERIFKELDNKISLVISKEKQITLVKNIIINDIATTLLAEEKQQEFKLIQSNETVDVSLVDTLRLKLLTDASFYDKINFSVAFIPYQESKIHCISARGETKLALRVLISSEDLDKKNLVIQLIEHEIKRFQFQYSRYYDTTLQTLKDTLNPIKQEHLELKKISHQRMSLYRDICAELKLKRKMCKEWLYAMCFATLEYAILANKEKNYKVFNQKFKNFAVFEKTETDKPYRLRFDYDLNDKHDINVIVTCYQRLKTQCGNKRSGQILKKYTDLLSSTLTELSCDSTFKEILAKFAELNFDHRQQYFKMSQNTSGLVSSGNNLLLFYQRMLALTRAETIKLYQTFQAKVTDEEARQKASEQLTALNANIDKMTGIALSSENLLPSLLNAKQLFDDIHTQKNTLKSFISHYETQKLFDTRLKGTTNSISQALPAAPRQSRATSDPCPANVNNAFVTVANQIKAAILDVDFWHTSFGGQKIWLMNSSTTKVPLCISEMIQLLPGEEFTPDSAKIFIQAVKQKAENALKFPGFMRKHEVTCFLTEIMKVQMSKPSIHLDTLKKSGDWGCASKVNLEVHGRQRRVSIT